MPYIDLGLTDVGDYSDSLNNMTDINSYGTESATNNNHQTGGGPIDWLKSFFEDDESDDDMVDALERKDYKKLIEMQIDNIAKVDKNAESILHYIARDYSTHNLKEFVDKIFGYPSIDKIINQQNNKGETAVHIACKNGNHELITKLIEKGADPTIKDDEGCYVDSEDKEVEVEVEEEKEEEGIEEKKNRLANIIDKFLGKKNDNDTANFTDGPLDMSETAARQTQTIPLDLTDVGTIGETNAKEVDTEQFLVSITKKKAGDVETIDTDELLSNLNAKQSGGAYENADTDTEQFIDKIIKKINISQSGGIRSSVTGTRMLTPYGGGKRENTDSIEDTSDNIYGKSELGRMIKNQAREIHKKVIEKIIDLLEVDEDVARKYKAVLWKNVKDKFKNDNKSNLDLSLELEKMTNKTNLKKINPDDGSSIIEESRKKSEERSSAKKKSKKNNSEELSQTSSASVPDTNYSETSVSE